MTKLAHTLRTLIDVFPDDRPFALVGGLAVSARTEPRFTRDLDFAITVENDADAESIVFSLQGRGFMVVATIEHATTHRLATVRLRQDDRAPFVDLLFAACGMEREIVGSASPLEVLGVTVGVATVGHLIAMKLVSRDARRRPQDQLNMDALIGGHRAWSARRDARWGEWDGSAGPEGTGTSPIDRGGTRTLDRRSRRSCVDLVGLAKVADALEWERAEAAIELIRQRGFSRGRDLQAGLAEIRALAGD